MSGVDLRQVQELAIHRDIKTTMRYAHLAPGRGMEAVNRLNWELNEEAQNASLSA